MAERRRLRRLGRTRRDSGGASEPTDPTDPTDPTEQTDPGESAPSDTEETQEIPRLPASPAPQSPAPGPPTPGDAKDPEKADVEAVAAVAAVEDVEDTVPVTRRGSTSASNEPDVSADPAPAIPPERPRISRTPPPPPARDPGRGSEDDLARRRRQRGPRTGLRRAAPWLVAVLVVVLVAAGVWALWFSSLVTAERVEVRGATHVSTARVEAAAAVPTGRPLVRVDLDAVRRRVQRLPVVRSADVSRSWPHAVRITVVERTPVAVIDRGSGLQALDASGVLFRSFAKRPAGLPLVRTDPDVKAEALTEAARVVTALRVDGGDLAGRVDYLDVGSVDEIKLVLRSGRVVTWGSADQSRQKAEVLALLLKQKGRELDVSVPGRPTTRD